MLAIELALLVRDGKVVRGGGFTRVKRPLVERYRTLERAGITMVIDQEACEDVHRLGIAESCCSFQTPLRCFPIAANQHRAVRAPPAVTVHVAELRQRGCVVTLGCSSKRVDVGGRPFVRKRWPLLGVCTGAAPNLVSSSESVDLPTGTLTPVTNR